MEDSEQRESEVEEGDIRTTLAIIRTLEAEKRTHFAELRTGIGILTIPMSLLTILIATSNYYDPASVMSFIVALVFGIIGLSLVGIYLVVSAFQGIRENERLRREVSIDTRTLIQDRKDSVSDQSV
ncbi:MAG: hypothetical protein JSW61_08925 [Candidatus Thorarchaeota archaeon]|nr:MAG: hypothetical protein JSW61_08925 [Candidatus Thorarchaeota archaeon]